MQMRRNNKISTFLAIAGLMTVIGYAGATLMGCGTNGDPSAPSPPPPNPPTVEGKIKAINDSNMSQQNKDIAIGMVKAQAAKSGGTTPPAGGG